MAKARKPRISNYALVTVDQHGQNSMSEEHKEMAIEMAAIGLMNQQVADVLGVTRETLYRTRKKDEAFERRFSNAKLKSDIEVTMSLRKRAIGFKEKSLKPVVVSDGNDCGSHVEYCETETYYPPDMSAAKFWLCNRNPKDWRMKQDYSVADDSELAGLSDNDLEKLIIEELKKDGAI